MGNKNCYEVLQATDTKHCVDLGKLISFYDKLVRDGPTQPLISEPSEPFPDERISDYVQRRTREILVTYGTASGRPLPEYEYELSLRDVLLEIQDDIDDSKDGYCSRNPH